MSRASFTVIERTTARYTAQLVDETGTPIPAASLGTFTLTLYDDFTGQILNSRNGQNVLNQNGVTIDAGGNVTWTMAATDNAIVGTRELERHTALFAWTFGAKGGNHEVGLLVSNLRKVS